MHPFKAAVCLCGGQGRHKGTPGGHALCDEIETTSPVRYVV